MSCFLDCRGKIAPFKTFKFKRNVFFSAITVISRMSGTLGITLFNTGLIFLQKEFCTALRSNFSTNDKLTVDFYEAKRFWGVVLAVFSSLLVWVSVRHRLLS